MEEEFVLNDSQYDALTSEAKETFFISGVGGGKTFTLGAAIIMYSQIEGSIGFLGSPSKDAMKNATFPQVQESLHKLGVLENVHYVVNERPPAAWGITPFSSLGSGSIITFAWGSYLILDGLHNFNKLRGTELDYILVDEYRDVSSGAREVMIARLRGTTFKELGIKSKILYATTPPDNPLELAELSKKQNPEIRFIFTSSFENQANLPEGYIESLLNIYDDETADREVYGKLTAVVKNQFAYQYSEKKHNKLLKLDPKRDIYLAFDFNVDPMTCLLIQSDLETYIRVVKEFRIENSDTYAMCDAIKVYCGHLDLYIEVTGDASGDNRQPATRGAVTHYEIILNELNLRKHQIKTPTYNASISNSRILLNSMLQHFPEFVIDQDECPFLCKDLKFVQTDKSRDGKVGIKKAGKGNDMDYASMTHLLDCLRYFLQTYFWEWIETVER